MEKPEKLFENGPEWEWDQEDQDSWLARLGDAWAILYLPCPPVTDGYEPYFLNKGPVSPLPEALAWLRDRILEYRDALNRITPPSAEWVPVEEVELQPGTYTVLRIDEVGTETLDDDGDWVDRRGVYGGSPTHILCIAGHPIEVPPAPGGG